MNIQLTPSAAKGYLKSAIGLVLLAAIAVTAIELFVNIPGVRSIPLTQEAGIGMAGLGFLYSKL